MPRRFWLLVPLLIASTAAISAWAVGVAATGSAVDPDFLLEPVPFLDRHAVLIALFGAAVLVGIGVSWASTARAVAVSGWFAVGAALVAGAWLGTTYAVATMPVVGANIGGAMMLLLTAPVLVGATVLMVGAEQGMRRRRRAGD